MHLVEFGIVGAGHRALDAYFDASVRLMHVAAHLQRQLVVPLGPGPVAHDLDEHVVGHLLALERVRESELISVDDALVELERFRRYPLLGLDGYDVVATHNLFAVTQTIVKAYVYGRIDRIKKGDEEDARAAPMLLYATFGVQLAFIFVDNLFYWEAN